MAEQSTTIVLHLEKVTKNFGGLQALSGVSVSFKAGEFVGLIGPNGSGKTTLINCISGLYRPDSGSIRFGRVTISRLPPHGIYRLGIGRTFQISKVFNRLTVLDNLRIPALTEGKLHPRNLDDRSREILKQLKLERHRSVNAENLSGGQKKLLELGMLMMMDPQFLLLDEPFAGVHPELKSQLEEYLCQLNRNRKTIILVSHEMSSIFRICQRLVVLDHGVLIADGPPEAVRSDARVINAYLGSADEA
jgi:branched-chain amino acid transport system ATP-binding protein